jgi:hypothetical protein
MKNQPDWILMDNPLHQLKDIYPQEEIKVHSILCGSRADDLLIMSAQKQLKMKLTMHVLLIEAIHFGSSSPENIRHVRHITMIQADITMIQVDFFSSSNHSIVLHVSICSGPLVDDLTVPRSFQHGVASGDPTVSF